MRWPRSHIYPSTRGLRFAESQSGPLRRVPPPSSYSYGMPMAPRALPKPQRKPKPAPGHYTIQARDLRARNRAAALEDVRKAAAYCRANSVGAKAAMATGMFPLATRHKVTGELQKAQGDEQRTRDSHSQILTNVERRAAQAR